MISVNDWASKCAERIKCQTSGLSVERMAAIIATFAEPLMQTLRNSHRLHHHCDYTPRHCCPQCSCKSWVGEEHVDSDDDEYPPNSNKPCTCGADAWNARVDAALVGELKP